MSNGAADFRLILSCWDLCELSEDDLKTWDIAALNLAAAQGLPGLDAVNLIAFLALTRALQITSLVQVNALNASQAAMASVAGIVLFREQASPALALGVSLTVLGLLIMPRHKPVED